MTFPGERKGSFRAALLKYVGYCELLIRGRRNGLPKGEQKRLTRRMDRIVNKHFIYDGGRRLADTIRNAVMRDINKQ